MTESNVIESIDKIDFAKIEKTIIDDFINYPPPNKIYVIEKQRLE